MSVMTEKTVGELAVASPAAARVFERLGIDYCCGGDRTLEQACKAAHVPLEQVRNSLEEAERAPKADGTGQDWQTAPLLVSLPELSTIAAAVLAELHGRMGYFPPVIRRRRIGGSPRVVFEVAEIVNLQELREEARLRRNTLRGGNKE